MADRTPRALAVGGVIATAVAATFLLMPAIRQLDWPDHMWVGAAVMIVPTAALLTATGFLYYGFWRSLAVAVGVMVLASVITWAVAIFALAAALAQSPAGTILGIVLYATPAVAVLVLGGLALRFVPAKAATGEENRNHAVTSH